MAIELNGTTGITTPGLTNTGTETIVNLTTTGNTILGDASTDTLNVGNGGLIKDASGNLGLGVTPAAWSLANLSAFQIQQGSIYGYGANNNEIGFGGNTYFNAGWKYIQTGLAAHYRINAANSGQHQWFTAPTGTAGNAITFTQAMTLDANGNLGLGTTSPNNYAGYGTITLNGSSGGVFDISVGNTRTGSIYATSARLNIGSVTSVPIVFETNSTERMRLDASGNLGLGVTPSAWNSSLKALQIQTTGIAANNGSFANFSYNTYYDSVGYKYQISAAALMYQQNNSSGHIWYTAPSGTAGNAITFTQAMTLDASSNLTVAARGAVASGSSSSPSHGLRITGSGNTSSNNGGFFNVRMVTLNGDGGSNSGNTFVSNLYGAKGVCIAAFNSSGDSVSPSTYCANSNLCTFVALVSS